MTPRDVPKLHLVGPLAIPEPGDYVRIAYEAATGGCDAIHVRLPGKSGGEVFEPATAVRERLEELPARLIVNDRIDVALLVGADGVHLGERGIGVAETRRLVSDDTMIGRSVHDVEGAVRAERDGATYVLAGHIFETRSKAGQPGRGLDWLGEVVRAVNIPVIAIGGISIARIELVLEAGAFGVALGRELLQAADPKLVARDAARIIERFGGR